MAHPFPQRHPAASCAHSPPEARSAGVSARLPRCPSSCQPSPHGLRLGKDRTMAVPSDLLQLAQQHRVATEFHDWQGRKVDVPESTLRKILDAMGVGATGVAPTPEGLPPLLVVREGEAASLPLLLGAGDRAAATLVLEGGEQRRLSPVGGATDVDASGEDPGTGLALPADLPVGYHRLRIDAARRTDEVPLVVTPGFLGLPDTVGDDRGWGFAVQLYSARSRKSWGVGDLGDLAELARWSAELGADYILVNPLHAAEPVAPLEPSPYLPSSRRFWNPLYLRVEDVPEYDQLDAEERAGIQALAAELAEELRGKDLIDRDAAWTAKRAALELLHRTRRRDEQEDAYR